MIKISNVIKRYSKDNHNLMVIKKLKRRANLSKIKKTNGSNSVDLIGCIC